MPSEKEQSCPHCPHGTKGEEGSRLQGLRGSGAPDPTLTLSKPLLVMMSPVWDLVEISRHTPPKLPRGGGENGYRSKLIFRENIFENLPFCANNY